MIFKSDRLFLFIFGILLVFSIGFKSDLNASEPSMTVEPSEKFIASLARERGVGASQRAYSYYWQGQYSKAIVILEDLLKSSKEQDTATIHDYLGIIYREVGQLGKSIEHFKDALAIYEEKKDLAAREKTLVEQGRTFNDMGEWKQSRSVLEKAISSIDKNLSLASLAYRSLGTSYWLEGDFERAVEACETSRNLASLANNPEGVVVALNNLANILKSRRFHYLSQIPDVVAEGNTSEGNRLEFLAEQDRQAALIASRRAIKAGEQNQSLSVVRAMLNESELSSRFDYRLQARKLLKNAPPSRIKAELLISLSFLEEEKSIELLKEAISIAERFEAERIEAFALLRLGEVYESAKQYEQALFSTERGESISQQIMANDILYRLQWLSGRIYRTTGEQQEAIVSYRNAIAALQKLRQALSGNLFLLQAKPSQSPESIYREFIMLLLENNPNRQIKETLDTYEQLQLSELQSFFGDACLELRQAVTTPHFSPYSAIIHTIILEDSTHAILELPNGSVYTHRIEIKASQLEKLLKQWRKQLENIAVPAEFLELSQYFYSLLIEPLESPLAESQVKELTFVNDGLLRNVPMAALHDGKQFLIEKYPISISIGLNLKSPAPSNEKKEASIFGLSLPIKKPNSDLVEFPPLPFVKQETQQVKEIVGGERLIDRDFSQASFEKEIVEDRSIVHMATHGEFGGSLKSTFLRTFDRSVSLPEFERIVGQRQKAIDLLVLSACDTASGNQKAVLGLAGVAIRSGVSQVVASLWAIDDETTPKIIAEFYRYLEKGLSVSQALRQAQIDRIKDTYVSRWSAFIAIKN
jgi:CHAT domain-containing protein/Tfp pilus assembly protein PilF